MKHLRYPLALAAAAAGLLAVASATASAAPTASMFVHSAKSGELKGGRLVLRDVPRKVRWLNNRGTSGVLSIRRMHRELFSRGTPPSIGALHIQGRRRTREVTVKLRRPSYNASSGTVRYRVERLSGAALPRQFGRASLSIVGAPRSSHSAGCTA